MATVIVQIISRGNPDWNQADTVHQAWSFDAKTPAAAMSTAMRFCRKGWDLEEEFGEVKKVRLCGELAYVKLICQ